MFSWFVYFTLVLGHSGRDVKSSPTTGWCPDTVSVNGERIYSPSIFSFILELYFARSASQPPTQALWNKSFSFCLYSVTSQLSWEMLWKCTQLNCPNAVWVLKTILCSPGWHSSPSLESVRVLCGLSSVDQGLARENTVIFFKKNYWVLPAAFIMHKQYLGVSLIPLLLKAVLSVIAFILQISCNYWCSCWGQCYSCDWDVRCLPLTSSSFSPLPLF